MDECKIDFTFTVSLWYQIDVSSCISELFFADISSAAEYCGTVSCA